MDTVIPVTSQPETSFNSSGYYTPKGHLNQKIVKDAENLVNQSPRYSTTSAEYSVPVSPVSKFPSSSPLIVISPPDASTPPTTIIPTRTKSPTSSNPPPVSSIHTKTHYTLSPRASQLPEATHRRSLIVAIIAAGLVFLAVIFMLLLVLNVYK